jgi:A/G-specific adenine glycosylase
LSEIILQQTRVDQGLPYYERFIANYPNVHALAKADQQDVLKSWEGLGYYSRARNLHATAQLVAFEMKGLFPSSYEGLLKLKGVGPYTAAAIASISFGEKTAVLDGNVFRFVARFFGVHDDISDQKSRKSFLKILNELIPDIRPDLFNQAMMEYGATVCKPLPNCEGCIFLKDCYARKHRVISDLPVKAKKTKVTEEFIDYIIFRQGDNTLMRKREIGVWQGLFEFYSLSNEDVITFIKKSSGKDAKLSLKQSSPAIKHLLTHKKLWITFHEVEVPDNTMMLELAKDLKLNIFSWQDVLTLPSAKVIVNHLRHIKF